VAERIKIVVVASGAHPDVLTVQDAMRQVLDIFDMIEPAPGVQWKLLHATTNSPLTIEGEAVSLEPSVDISVIARAQKQILARNWQAVTSGKLPDDPKFNLKLAKRVLERNTNGVGATEIDFELGEPVRVTPTVAKRAISAFEEKPIFFFESTAAHEEVGTIEGQLQEVGTHYKQPAVKIETRHKEIWVRLSEDLQPVFQNKASYQDVWHHQRVMVRGRIKYDSEGDIVSMLATDIRRIAPPTVTVEQLKDTRFTAGLSISEYLDRFRDGTLD
jgi:hypothetical protein